MPLALIGEKLSHSYSPQIHKMVFNKLEIIDNYSLIELQKDELESFCNRVKNDELQGFNITIPYKKDIMEFLDEIDPKAKKIGAINTVKNVDGKLFGYNTDYYGYLYSVEKLGINLQGKKAIVLGNGGSAKAVIEVMRDLGAKDIYLVTRDKSKITEVSEDVILINYDELGGIGQAELITNCTPVGMYPNEGNSPIDKKSFELYSFAIDLIYNPRETQFIVDAKAHNVKTLNGLYMLLGQAIKAEELWQNMELNREFIDSIYPELEKIVYGG